jgi:DNA-directed RNA polymerase subunit RPC12/RpoP
MVVCFCPACGKKVFIQGVAEGVYPICFTHCGHEITIIEAKKQKKGKK